ncbi:MAG: TetR/AcrR family transcriptional regulator, partial [Oscillospiraceae bacterium]|nr:TetR/AcrR family transcriptional regulator [Oscillospiraceae bacterium]
FFSNTFAKSLFMAYAERNSLITAIFSGSRKEQLPKRMHAAIKELFFSQYPQYADDLEKNIILTYSVYGSYYAFSENREYGDDAVIDIIGEASSLLLK